MNLAALEHVLRAAAAITGQDEFIVVDTRFLPSILPPGWKQRLVHVQNENTRGALGLCLDPHDLVVAKLIAGREKDLRFARDALSAGLVAYDELLARLETVEAEPASLVAARARLAAARRD